ncbi:MAG: transporter, family, staphyloferrin biosynthesis exporter [Chloroflexota bacterium]|nr:transporter, family, staphyloferrin biosynthesis exporter [Chloroflexota bacterium]
MAPGRTALATPCWRLSLNAPPSPVERRELPPATGPLRLVSSLRYRDWRYLWSGLMVAQTGEWMDSLALNWIVLVLTDSPLALGTLNLMRGLPTLALAMAGGVIADRFDRRLLMVGTQVSSMLCTAVLALLASAELLEIWHIYIGLLVRGVINAVNSPARASIVGDLVPRSDIGNAVALQSNVFNVTRMVGPAIAGLLIAVSGAAIVLWLNAASAGICAIAILGMTRGAGKMAKPVTSAWSAMVEGVDYLRREPVVFMLLLLGIIPFILGQPYQSMLPVFAKDVLVVGPEGLGLLTTAAAAGSMTGAFTISSLGNFRRKGLVMMIGLLSFGTLLVVFSHTPWPLVAAVVLFFIGISTQVYQTTNSTLIQLIVPSAYRGRVFGIHQMDRGFIPVGSFVAGAIAEGAGAPFAVAIMGGSLTLASVAVLLFVPRMRRLE